MDLPLLKAGFATVPVPLSLMMVIFLWLKMSVSLIITLLAEEFIYMNLLKMLLFVKCLKKQAYDMRSIGLHLFMKISLWEI